MLQDLLKKHFGNDETKINAFLEDMKTNKIYTTNEENIDVRYGKLKGNFEALTAKEQEAQALIEELKKTNGNDLQAKVTEYETKIAELEKQKVEMTIENAIKFELLAKGAKASDIDYLIYRAKNSDAELKLDKEGNVKGLDNLVTDLQKTYSGNFEDSVKKKVDVKKLPNDDDKKDTMTKADFLKKSYAERAQFAQDNPEAFQALMNE